MQRVIKTLFTVFFLCYFISTFSSNVQAYKEMSQNLIGGSNYDSFKSIIELSDGNFIAIGKSTSNDLDISDGNNGQEDGMIFKLNHEGNIIWNITIGGSTSDELNSVIELQDGNIIVVGSTYSNDLDITDGNNGYNDAIVFKLDQEGNIIWNKTFGGSNHDYLYDVIETDDNKIIAVGVTESNNGDVTNSYQHEDGMIIKLDLNGDLIWSKNYGGDGRDIILDLTKTQDERLIAVGYTNSISHDITDGSNGQWDSWIINFNTDGNIVWNRTIGGTKDDYFSSVIQSNDGNLVAIGYTYSNDIDYVGHHNGDIDGLIVKMDSSGDVLWYDTFGGTNSDYFRSIVESNENNYIIVGSTSSNDIDITDGNNGNEDALIIKYDNNGNIKGSITFGGISNDNLSSIILSKSNHLLSVGTTNSNDRDITVQSNGGNDALFLNLAVFDITAPIITLKNNQYLIVNAGIGDDSLLGASAVDNNINDQNISVAMVGSVNWSTPGNYVIEYISKDSSENKTSLKQYIKILPAIQSNIPYDQWEKDLDIDSSGSYLDGLETYDNNIIIIDNKNIIKMNNNWEILWTNNYIDNMTSIIETSDNNFVITGTSFDSKYDGNNGKFDAVIFKIDSAGNLLWYRTIGGASGDAFYSAIELENGDLLTVGFTSSNEYDITDDNYGSSDGLLIRFDKDGNKLWDTTIGGSKEDMFYKAVETTDGTILAVGITMSNDYDLTGGKDGYGYDGVITKVAANGTLIWSKVVGSMQYDYLNDIIATPDGNYVIVGSMYYQNDITTNYFSYFGGLFLKIDDDGNVLIAKGISKGYSTSFSKIENTGDGSYLIKGRYESRIGYHAFIEKIDQNGNVIWDTTNSDISDFSSFIQLSNNDILTTTNNLIYYHLPLEFELKQDIILNINEVVEWNEILNLDESYRVSSDTIIDTSNYGKYTITLSIHKNDFEYIKRYNVYIGEQSESPLLYINNKDLEIITLGEEYQYPDIFTFDYQDGMNVDSTLNIITDLDTSRIGSYTVTYQVNDNEGNTSKKFFTVYVVEEIKPMLLFDDNRTVILHEINSPYNYKEYKAVDFKDGEISELVNVIGEVDVTLKGIYPITYQITDSDGNNSTYSYKVFVLDEQNPLLNVESDKTVLHQKGIEYKFPQAMAQDLVDGNISDKIQIIGSVDYDTTGAYPVIYEITDSNENKNRFEYTVYVLNGEQPLVILEQDYIVTQLNDQFTVPTYVAFDYKEGNVTDKVIITGEVDVFKAGIYKIIYQIIDLDGNKYEKELTVYVKDSIAPVLEGLKDLEFQFGIQEIDWYNGIIAHDNNDGDLTFKIKIYFNNLKLSQVGSYNIKYYVEDSSGNNTEETINIKIVDTEKPILFIEEEIVSEVGYMPFYMSGVSSIDNYAGDITANILFDDSNVNIDQVGVYKITYQVTDLYNNTRIEDRVVRIVDTTKPKILINGDKYIYIEYEGTYNESGAVFTDNLDIEGTVIIGGELVDTGVLGSYIITYNATDSNGNEAVEVTRTVIVQDQVKPEIKLVGDGTIYIEYEEPYIELGAMFSDNYDKEGKVIVGGDSVDTSTLGSYNITYTTTDSNGNEAENVTRTVTVQDSKKPEIIITGDETIYIEYLADYTEQRATFTDNYDVEGVVIVGGDIVDTSILKSYTVTYNMTDHSGNVADQVARTVIVQDTTKPLLQLKPGIDTVYVGSTWIDQGINVSDNYDTELTIEKSSILIDTSEANRFEIIYTVTDSSGNTSTLTRIVNVVEKEFELSIDLKLGNDTVIKGNTWFDGGCQYNLNNETYDCEIKESNVDINTPGVYTVTYSVEVNNKTIEKKRYVYVLEGINDDVKEAALVPNRKEEEV
jgi:Domain of unknown function (DUF5011)